MVGGVILVFLEGEKRFAHAREGVEHAEVLGGIGLEMFFVGAGDHFEELLGKLSDAEMESDQGEVGRAGVAGEFEEELLGLEDLVTAFTRVKVVLVTAVVPAGEVGEVNVEAPLSQFLPDDSKGIAGIEELVDGVNVFFGQVRDLAIAPARAFVVRGRGLGLGRRNGDGGLSGSRCGAGGGGPRRGQWNGS